MASTIYYGVSTTPGNQQVKKVKMANTDFQLQEGDILSVYFAFKNEIENPTLALYIGDVNEEINQSNASGDTIYNTGRLPVQIGAWTNGEIVNFSYTHNGSITESNDNIYYWEIVSKAVATNDTYGTVVLDGEDDGSAASIRKVKTLIQNIGSGELEYIPTIENGTEIGTLKLTNFDEEGAVDYDHSYETTIYVPTIPSIVSAFTNDSGYITSQLTNDLNFVGSSKKLRVGTSTAIDLDEDTTHNFIVNSQGTIDLIPVSQVRVGTANANKSLRVYGAITGDFLNSATLSVDTINSRNSGGTISFGSPISAETGTITNLTTNGITIGNQSLSQYIQSFLSEESATSTLNSWLHEQLNGYLVTESYFAPFNIAPDGVQVIAFATDPQYAPRGTEQMTIAESGNLNKEGYEIVGIIRWETFLDGTSNPQNAHVYGIYWDNNDCTTGNLYMKITTSLSNTTAVSTKGKVRAEILYKKII